MNDAVTRLTQIAKLFTRHQLDKIHQSRNPERISMDNITHMTDETIVHLVRTKNKELYSEIIKRYQKKLLRYASYLIGNDADGADIVQESFIKAYINLNGFDTKKKFSSWIYRIAHNEAMNAWRKYKHIEPMNENLDYISDENIEDEYIRIELQSMTHDCLLAIPVIYREPATLYYLDEKSYEEISDILRLPIGTVGTRISRAKTHLKKICQKKS